MVKTCLKLKDFVIFVGDFVCAKNFCIQKYLKFVSTNWEKSIILLKKFVKQMSLKNSKVSANFCIPKNNLRYNFFIALPFLHQFLHNIFYTRFLHQIY